MKKSDLRTGMVVTTKDGDHFRVFLNTVTNLNPEINGVLIKIDHKNASWLDLKSFNDDLESYGGYTIVKIEIPRILTDLVGLYNEIGKVTIWEREEVKEITVAEIEKILGYKVKIVAEN